MNIQDKMINVMAAGLSKREVRGLKKLFLNPGKTKRHYRLTQWKPLNKIDIVLIGPDDSRVLKKWQEMNESRNDCPAAIYFCDKDSDISDLDILLNACTRPVKKSKIIEMLDQVPVVKIPSNDPNKNVKNIERDSHQLAA